jgi:hypothetical protein
LRADWRMNQIWPRTYVTKRLSSMKYQRTDCSSFRSCQRARVAPAFQCSTCTNCRGRHPATLLRYRTTQFPSVANCWKNCSDSTTSTPSSKTSTGPTSSAMSMPSRLALPSRHFVPYSATKTSSYHNKQLRQSFPRATKTIARTSFSKRWLAGARTSLRTAPDTLAARAEP